MTRRTTNKRRRDAGRPRGAPVEAAVLEATLAELGEAGFEGLRVERVAARAEVNKTTVYRRWPTREALVVAALERVLDGISSTAQATGPADTGSLAGDLRVLLRRVADVVARPLGRVLLRASLADDAAAAVAALAAGRLAATAAPGLALVDRARSRGEWREGVPAEVLLSAAVGAVLHRVLLEHAAVSDEWLGALVDVLVHGVRPR